MAQIKLNTIEIILVANYKDTLIQIIQIVTTGFNSAVKSNLEKENIVRLVL